MKLSTKYFLLIGTLHVALGVTIFLLLEETKLYFLLAEVLLLVSLVLSVRVYLGFIRPIRLMQRGTDALKDGDYNITYVQTGTRELDSLVEVFNQMILRIREERVSLKEQHFFLQKLMQASPHGIVVFDFDGQVSMINPEARQLLGIPEDQSDFSWDTLEHPVVQAVSGLRSGESTIVRVDGWKPYKCHVSHFIHRGFERKFLLLENLSNEILRSEKEAYGKIIRMMAHEVNNSIGAINSILHTVLQVLREQVPEEQESGKALEVAAQRNDQLNRFMKNFAEVARLPEPRFAEVDLVPLSQRMAVLFRAQLLERDITLVEQYPEHPVRVRADEVLLEQVYVNVLRNAMEAIESDGSIEIEVREDRSLYIRDNGSGLPEEVREKLFQPFYSSKPQGQGVGLTIVKEILHHHRAQFSLAPTRDGRTEFSVRFSE